MSSFSQRTQRRRRQKPADPALVDAIAVAMERVGIKEIVDWGAGEGRFVRALREKGFLVQGYDGTPGIADLTDGAVLEWDLTLRSFIPPAPGAICIEVGEHIAPEHCDAFLDNIVTNTGRLLIVSWARPGQRGRGHVNCLRPEFVVGRILSRSSPMRKVILDEELTDFLRAAAGKGWDQKLLAFRRLT